MNQNTELELSREGDEVVFTFISPETKVKFSATPDQTVMIATRATQIALEIDIEQSYKDDKATALEAMKNNIAIH